MAFCPGDHAVCAGCLSESAIEQVAQGGAQLICQHFAGCALPFEAVELQGRLPAHLLAAFEPREEDPPIPLVREDDGHHEPEDEDAEQIYDAQGDGEEDVPHGAEEDEEQTESLGATQTIQEYIDRCVREIEQHRLRAVPDVVPSAVYPQFKGKARVRSIHD